MDSGIFVEQSARGAIVEDNRPKDNRPKGQPVRLYLPGAPDSLARRNTVVGLRQARMSEGATASPSGTHQAPRSSTTTSATDATASSGSPAARTFQL